MERRQQEAKDRERHEIFDAVRRVNGLTLAQLEGMPLDRVETMLRQVRPSFNQIDPNLLASAIRSYSSSLRDNPANS